MGYRPEIADRLRALAGELARDAWVLDVGCGERIYESLVGAAHYCGVDVPFSGRLPEHKLPHVLFDGLRLPFHDGSFQLVVCTEVLEHALDAAALAREMRRVLGPDGRLLVTVPFIWGEHEMPYDFRRFSSEGIRRLLTQAGLEVVSLERAVPGVRALQLLAHSEINACKVRHGGRGRLFRLAELPGRVLARALFAYWDRLYTFERVFIRSIVVARPSGPPGDPRPGAGPR